MIICSFFLLVSLLSSCELYYTPPDVNTVMLVDIGLSYNGTDVNPLQGTINDARELDKAFSAIFGGDTFTPLLMIQENMQNADDALFPTKDHLVSQLSTNIAKLQENDLLIISYSGHGTGSGAFVLAPKQGNKLFLPDGKTVNEQCLLSVQELTSIIAENKGKTLLLLDCCYAGCFIEENNLAVSLVEQEHAIQQAYMNWFHTTDGVSNLFVLAATTMDNTSKEPQIGNPIHGYFTKALLEGLGWDEKTQTLARDNKNCTVDSLYAYIHEHQDFPTEGEYPWKYQHPMVSSGPLDLVLF